MRSWWSCAAMWLLGAQSAPVGKGASNESMLLNDTVKVPIYGGLSIYAYFFIDVLLGADASQRASMIVDTGSRSAGVVCAACDGCEEQHHLDPPFQVERSTSGQWLECNSSACEANCTAEDRCPFEAKYSEGSYLSGFWLTDYVALGDSPQVPPRRTQLGCSTRSSRQFTRQRASGIMGLAPPPPPFDAQAARLQPTEARAPAILRDLFGATVFSLCFAQWGGLLTIGADEDGWANETVQWLTMDTSYLYRIYPKALWLGSTIVGAGDVSFGNTIVDSGTSFTLLPTLVFRTLMTALLVHCAMHQGCGATALGADCWQVNNGTVGPTGFPSLEMEFGGGGLVEWPPHSYLFVRDPLFEPDVWCLAIQAHPHRETLLGVSWMLHHRVIFDTVGSRLGVADTRCPEQEDRPEFTSVTTSTTGIVMQNSTDANATLDEDQHRTSSDSNDTSNDTASAGTSSGISMGTSMNIGFDQNQSNLTTPGDTVRVKDTSPSSDTAANSTMGVSSNATESTSNTNSSGYMDPSNATTTTAAAGIVNATTTQVNSDLELESAPDLPSEGANVNGSLLLENNPDNVNGDALLENHSDFMNESNAAVMLNGSGMHPRSDAQVVSPEAEPHFNATNVTDDVASTPAVDTSGSLHVSNTSILEQDADELQLNFTANVSNDSEVRLSSSPNVPDRGNDTQRLTFAPANASESSIVVDDVGVNPIGSEGAGVPINSSTDFEAAFSQGRVWRGSRSTRLRCRLLFTGLALPSTLVAAVLALRGLASARWRMRRLAPGVAWVRIQSAGIMAGRSLGEQVRLLG